MLRDKLESLEEAFALVTLYEELEINEDVPRFQPFVPESNSSSNKDK